MPIGTTLIENSTHSHVSVHIWKCVLLFHPFLKKNDLEACVRKEYAIPYLLSQIAMNSLNCLYYERIDAVLETRDTKRPATAIFTVATISSTRMVQFAANLKLPISGE